MEEQMELFRDRSHSLEEPEMKKGIYKKMEPSWDLSSREYDGKEINIITFKDGKELSMPQIEYMFEKNKSAAEPIPSKATSKEILNFLNEKNPTREEFINYFSGKRLNKGGTPMLEKQMELFEDGGLKDEGGMVDEESGNDVPVGSTRKEVRDDIPAMLSEGEFVFPADVVRYVGLDKLMQIRQEAKMGLKQMEAMGQMGNSDEATIPDDEEYPSLDILVLAGKEEDDDKIKELAQGGFLKAQAGTFVADTGLGEVMPSSFDSDVLEAEQADQFDTFIPPSSMTPPEPIPAPAGGFRPKFLTDTGTAPTSTVTKPITPSIETVTQQPEEKPFFETVEDVYKTVEYINPETGERRTFSVYNGQPIGDIPEGFITVAEYEKQQDETTDDLESTQVETAQVRKNDDNKMSLRQVKTQDKTGKSLQELLDMDKTEFKKSLDQMKTLTTVGSALSTSLGIVPSAVFGAGLVAKYNDMLEVAKERGIDVSGHMRKKSIFGGEKSLYENLKSYDDKTGKLVAGQRGDFGDTYLGDLLGFDGTPGIQARDAAGNLIGLKASLGGARRDQSVDKADFGVASTVETKATTKPKTQSEKTAAAKSATDDWISATQAVQSTSTDDPKAWSDAIRAQSDASREATRAIREASGWGTDAYNPNWRDE